MRALLERAVRRTLRMSIHQALLQLSPVETRLLVLFWHLAERWGHVTPDGISVRLRMSHELLGQLVGSRRASVTTGAAQDRRERPASCARPTARGCCAAPRPTSSPRSTGSGARGRRRDRSGSAGVACPCARRGRLQVRVLRLQARPRDAGQPRAPAPRPAPWRVRRRGAGALARVARPRHLRADRYACGDHRGELKARVREHYGTLGWHPWAKGPHPWRGRRGTDRARALRRRTNSAFGP